MITPDAKCVNNGKKVNEAINAINPLLGMSVGYTAGGTPPQVTYSDTEVKILLPLADSVEGFSLEELDIVDSNNAASSRYFMTSLSSVSTYGTTKTLTPGTPTGRQSSAPTSTDRNSLGGTPNNKNRDKLNTGAGTIGNGGGGAAGGGGVGGGGGTGIGGGGTSRNIPMTRSGGVDMGALEALVNSGNASQYQKDILNKMQGGVGGGGGGTSRNIPMTRSGGVDMGALEALVSSGNASQYQEDILNKMQGGVGGGGGGAVSSGGGGGLDARAGSSRNIPMTSSGHVDMRALEALVNSGNASQYQKDILNKMRGSESDAINRDKSRDIPSTSSGHVDMRALEALVNSGNASQYQKDILKKMRGSESDAINRDRSGDIPTTSGALRDDGFTTRTAPQPSGALRDDGFTTRTAPQPSGALRDDSGQPTAPPRVGGMPPNQPTTSTKANDPVAKRWANYLQSKENLVYSLSRQLREAKKNDTQRWDASKNMWMFKKFGDPDSAPVQALETRLKVAKAELKKAQARS